MSDKRCFLVVGPESSGNRLLASLLVRAGCKGKGATFQPFDKTLPNEESPVVVIRSFPHGDVWLDLEKIIAKLLTRGYNVVVLVTVRNAVAVIGSQIKRGHSLTEDLAEYQNNRAYAHIYNSLMNYGVHSFTIPYESIILHPEESVKALLKLLRLPQVTKGRVQVEGISRDIEDQNLKHYKAFLEEGNED